ncbi:MAG: signal peptidase I [Candidatus Paceibacterota bacterium]|jgi:signal peptidase I
MENNNNQGNINNSEKLTSKKWFQNIWDLIKYAIIALIIVIPIRTFIVQPFVVSGDSMVPTFHDGEYLIVDELSYLIGNPERGEVIIFRYPNDTKRFFIKRIIGLPNEEIKIQGDQITVINKENPKGFQLTEPYISEKFDTTISLKTGDNEYFVLGDNRNRSSDSRVWGVLPGKLIIGRAYLRLLPFKEASYLPGYYQENK